VPTINRISSTAYYARFAQIAADAARLLGKRADAARYDALFTHIRRDFNAAFLGADGVYRERTVPGAPSTSAGGPPPAAGPMREYVQAAQILPLAFGLVPDSLRGAVASRLADDMVNKSGGNAYVGILGARYVLPVLTETGHHDAAYIAATQTDEPSWGYWTEVAGFTALGEHWPSTTRSRSHHMFGSIVQWMYEDLAGVRPLEPGYRKIEFRPNVSALGSDSVSASYESVRGTVSVRWKRSSNALELDVVVPPNATGVVYVPATNAAMVREVGGTRSIAASRAESVRLIGVRGDRVAYEVGSGSYRFRVGGSSQR